MFVQKSPLALGAHVMILTSSIFLIPDNKATQPSHFHFSRRRKTLFIERKSFLKPELELTQDTGIVSRKCFTLLDLV